MYHIFLIYSSVEGPLGCFRVLVINNDAMSILEQMPLWYNCASFGYMTRSGMVRSWGRLIPNFLKNCHTNFKSDSMNLHSHQQWRSYHWHPLQYKLLTVFLTLVFLAGVRWYLRVILICISVMTMDVEKFLKCLSVILYSSVENTVFRSIHQFLIGLYNILISNFLSSLCILQISPLSNVRLVKIFSHIVGCHFIFLALSFALQKLLSFKHSH